MCALPSGVGVSVDAGPAAFDVVGAYRGGTAVRATAPTHGRDGPAHRARGAALDARGAGGGGEAASLAAAARTTWRWLRLVALTLADDLAARDWRVPPRPWWPDFCARFALPAPHPAPPAVDAPSHLRKHPARQTRVRAFANAWAARVALNSHLYQSNYAVAVGVALVVYVARKPWAAFVVAAITVACVRATAPRPLVLRSRRITKRERLAAATLFSALLLVASGLMPSFLVLALLSAFLILLHASLRHSHARAQLGDIGIRKDDW
jgi:hypothetical protein